MTREKRIEQAAWLVLRWEHQAAPNGGLASDMAYLRMVLTDSAPAEPASGAPCRECRGAGAFPTHDRNGEVDGGYFCPSCGGSGAAAGEGA